MYRKICLLIGLAVAGKDLYAQTNSYPSTGNIGFGISAVDKLHVNGNIISEGYFYSGNPDALRIYSGHPSTTSGNGQSYLILSAGGGFAKLGTPYPWGGDLDLTTYGINRMTFKPDGRIGVGTGSPEQRFTVLMDGSTNGTGIAVRAANASAAGSQPAFAWLNHLGAKKWYQYLNVSDSSLRFNNGSKDALVLLDDGRMGVNTPNPDRPLEISSNATNDDVYPLALTMKGFSTPSHSVGLTFKDGGYTADNAYPELMGAIKVGRVNAESVWQSTMSFLVNAVNSPSLAESSLTTAMFIDGGANVGIGTTTPTARLHVLGNLKADGNIKTKKLVVTQLGWSDYVFDETYKLRPLGSLESFIKQNKHLPEVPSAKEVAANGISVGDTQALLLKKIEELTLYIIEQQKQIEAQNKRIIQLEKTTR